MEKYSCPPLTRNTWGDAFYFVFASVEDAAKFALKQKDRIRNTDIGLNEEYHRKLISVLYCTRVKSIDSQTQ